MSLNKIKLNNHYFQKESETDVNKCIRNVIIRENGDLKIDFDHIKYSEDYVEDGIRQFVLMYFNQPIAIMSILPDVIENQIVINYQKLSKFND